MTGLKVQDGSNKLITVTVFAIDISKGVKRDKKSNVSISKVETNDPFLSFWDKTIKQAGCCTPLDVRQNAT
jgi:hypothetical protein